MLPKNILEQNIFWSEEISGPKIFELKQCLGPKQFGSKTMLYPIFFLANKEGANNQGRKNYLLDKKRPINSEQSGTS